MSSTKPITPVTPMPTATKEMLGKRLFKDTARLFLTTLKPAPCDPKSLQYNLHGRSLFLGNEPRY